MYNLKTWSKQNKFYLNRYKSKEAACAALLDVIQRQYEAKYLELKREVNEAIIRRGDN